MNWIFYEHEQLQLYWLEQINSIELIWSTGSIDQFDLIKLSWPTYFDLKNLIMLMGDVNQVDKLIQNQIH